MRYFWISNSTGLTQQISVSSRPEEKVLWKYASYLEENTNAKVWFNQVFLCSARNSYQSCSIKKAALKNSAIFTGKDLCWNLFLIKLQAFGCFLWKLRNLYAAFLHWTKSKPLFRSIFNSFFTTYSDVQGLPFPVDAGRKLNVHKTFRRPQDVFGMSYVRLIYVLCLLGSYVQTVEYLSQFFSMYDILCRWNISIK